MRGSKNRRILAIVVGVLALAIVAFVAIGLIFPGSWPGKVLQGAGVGGAEPAYGAATVDGNASEWGSIPVFSTMNRAWKTDKKVETNLYLTYDCESGTMYALVMTAGNWPVLRQPSESWIAINSINSKVTFTAFAWVGQGYDGNNDHAQGWEASFSIGEGNYTIWAHTNVDDGGQQTSGAQGVGLTIACHEPTAVFLNYFSAQFQQGSGVLLKWETASEIDNVGFNVYRDTTNRDKWTKLNTALIPSTVPAGSPVGAAYQWPDPQGTKKARYLLEAVDINGVVTKLGPIWTKR